MWLNVPRLNHCPAQQCFLPVSGPPGANDGVIQESYERQHSSKRFNNRVVKTGRRRHIGWESPRSEKLFVFQIGGRRMIGGKTTGHTAELLARKRLKQFS